MFRKRSCFLEHRTFFFSEKKQPECNKKSSRRWNESRQYTLDIVSLPSENRIIISEGWTSSGIFGDVDPLSSYVDPEKNITCLQLILRNCILFNREVTKVYVDEQTSIV